MNQIVAFLNPTALPNAAGAGARTTNTAVAGEGFAALLAQLQALAGNADISAAGPTPTQFQNLLGSATATTQAAANTLPSVDLAAATSDKTAGAQGDAQTLLDLLAALGGADKDSTPKSLLSDAANANANDGFAAQLAALQAALQNLQSQPTATVPDAATAVNTPVQSAAPDAQAVIAALQLGLRGTLAPPAATQTSNDKAAKAEAATAEKTTTQSAQQAIQALQVNQETTKPQADAKPLAAPKRPAIAPQNKAPAASTEPQTQTSAKEAKVSDTAVPSAPPAQTAAPQAATSDKPTPAQQQVAPASQAMATPVLPNTLAAQQFEVTVATAPQTAVPLGALAVNIARKFEEGSSQFEIRLHPAELGKLDISLSVADDGRVTAVLRAERPETLDMLQRDARSLEQQLRQAGLDVGSNALSFSLSNGNNNGRQSPFTGWPAFAEANDLAGTAKEEAASKYIAVSVRDGLDIRV